MTTEATPSSKRASLPIDRTGAERQRRYRERQKENKKQQSVIIERERDRMMEVIKYSQNEIKHLSKENSRLTNQNNSFAEKVNFIRQIIEEIAQALSPTERARLQIQMDARGLTKALKQDEQNAGN